MRTRTLRPVAAALAIAVLAAFAHPAPGLAAPANRDPEVTFSALSAPLPAVLQGLARAAGVSITVSPGIPETVRATVHFNRTPLRAVWSILEQVYSISITEAAPGTYIASRVVPRQRGLITTPSGWDGTVVRVYRLQNASAEAVAQALASLFAQGGRPQGQPAAPAQPQQPAQAQRPGQPQSQPPQAQQSQEPGQAPGQQEEPAGAGIAIVAVPESNQIVVRAPAHVAFIVAAAVRQLDSAPRQAAADGRPQPQRPQTPQGPVTESYTLKYAKPSAAARLLTEQVQGIKVSADDTRNTLLITGGAAEHERVRAILETVDRPVAQILVEAEVFSVQDSIQKTLGIDWTLNGEVTVSLASGTVVVDPLELLGRLRAAAQSGKARVVSRPRLLTVSGEQATITVGDQIPILGRDQQGNQVIVQTVNAGMRLQVVPRILPDGNVELQLLAEANTLSGFVGDVPIISQRSVQTRLSVRDGTPVIIGGLIGENRSTSTAKLPFLGDLPLVGALFRSTTERADRVELVIAVTPRVVSPGPITQPANGDRNGDRTER